jgi:hypothetical protein
MGHIKALSGREALDQPFAHGPNTFRVCELLGRYCMARKLESSFLADMQYISMTAVNSMRASRGYPIVQIVGALAGAYAQARYLWPTAAPMAPGLDGSQLPSNRGGRWICQTRSPTISVAHDLQPRAVRGALQSGELVSLAILYGDVI